MKKKVEAKKPATRGRSRGAAKKKAAEPKTPKKQEEEEIDPKMIGKCLTAARVVL